MSQLSLPALPYRTAGHTCMPLPCLPQACSSVWGAAQAENAQGAVHWLKHLQFRSRCVALCSLGDPQGWEHPLFAVAHTFAGLFHDEFMGQSVHAGASFASTVQHHPALTTLDLSYNNNSLGESLQYITDALKFNTRITTVGMRGVVLTSDAVLCLGELMLATPTLPRVVDLTESGLDGNLNPLVTAMRTLPHQYDLVGVDFGNVPIVAEMAAHLRMVAKLLSRPTVVTMPSDLKRTDIFLLDGRQCVIDWEEGKFSKGRLVYANFDYLDFTTIRNRGLMRDGTPDMNLIGTFTMEESTPTINLPKIAAVSSSIVNVADYVMDIIVLVDLYAAGVKEGDFTLFAASLAILLFANIYTMYSLVQDGRSRAAILQPLSLTIVMDAYNFVCLGKVTGAIMPLRTTQPMQGLAAIHRLKLTEAMMEATPQTLLQSFQALKLLDPNPILIVSIALSLGSIVASLAQSDKAKMNAWRKSEAQKQVTYVTFGVLLAAAFRAAEIASNVVTVSLFAVFFSEAPAFYLYLGGLLGIKVLFTCFYWRFNFKHFGDVATSLFVFPGSDEVCLEWIKDVQRLPTSFYILVQVAADGVALTLMATMQDSLMVSSTDADRKSTYTNFFVVAIAVVVLKYILAGAMSAAHHYFPDFLYTDRRHQLSCGQVGRKNSDVGDTLLDATAARQKQQQPVKKRGASPSVVGEVPNPLRVDHPVNRGATLSPTAKSPPGGGSDAGAKLSGYRSNTARRMSLSTKRKAEAKATSPKGTEQHEDFEASTAWMRGPAEEAEAAKTTSRRGQKTSGKKGGTLPPARAASRSAAVSGGASAGAGGKASKKAYRRQSVAVSVQQAAQARFLSERSARVAKDLISDVDVDEL